jgi:exopolyphosphatase/guanosine-5'-triphosphate,3'-diphosphate pyrophosphatase
VTRLAAIDCGTNSIRLLIADVNDGDQSLVDVVRQMEIVRLGEGVDRTGRLSPIAIERTRVALDGYARQIVECGAKRVRMVATSASRDAKNAADFRDMVETTLGIPPEVVSGDEEARLSFAGAVRGLPSELAAPYLVVDIGGGSTEFVTGDQSVDHAMSVDVGCVRITERHLHSDPPTAEQIEAAEVDIRAAVDRALTAVPGTSAATLVGLAGSVTTVTAMALGLTSYQPDLIHHARASYAQVAAVTTQLLGMTRAQRLAIGVMHPGRADVIGAGALILRTIMERSGTAGRPRDRVVASEHDILDGIAWSIA